MALTVEELVLEISQALEPLRERLADGEVDLLFAELGLPAPDVVLAAPGVVSAVADVIDELDELPAIISGLVTAIGDTDVDAIKDVVATATPLVKAVVAAVKVLADAVDDAGAAAGADRAEVEAFAAELPERLFGYATATYLERRQPVVAGVAGLFGVIETTSVAATAAAPAHVRRVLRFDRLGDLLDDPLGVLSDVYRWGQPTFNWDLFLVRLTRFATRISDFAFVQPDPLGGPPVLRVGMVDVGVTDDPDPGLRFALRRTIARQLDTVIPISPGLGFEMGIAAELEAGTALDILPPAELDVLPPTASVDGLARVGFVATGTGGALVLLGTAGGSRLEAGRLRASVGADLTWDVPTSIATGAFLAEAAVEDGKVVLSLAGADGFLSSILPAGDLELDFSLLAGWSSAEGLYFDGGAALGIDIPVDFDLGPIKIQMLHLGLGLSPEGIEVEASGAVSAQLGPFAMAIERMGTVAELSFPDDGGNLGPADLDFVFKPPSGIGVTLDAGVVKGGGYLYIDAEAGEYAGVLELTLGPVSIKAIGLLSTQLPDGGDGWAFLLLVFGEFTAVQLGFGFTLNGVGGIIGLQHGVSIDGLQSGLRTGVLDSVLFPADPVANAPSLIGQLRVVFPIVPRALTVGPALKIGWSTPALVTLKLGLILQFDDVLGAAPGPPSISRIVLLGQLKVQIPPVDELGVDAPALIQLQVDIVGAYDFDEQSLSIDAVLRDSHVAFLPLTGSLVVRARFGDDPTFVLAVGGFHPRFTDLPPGIPPQQRVGIQLRYGIVTVQITGYVAITSNSFQTGAEASLVAAGGGFRVEAYVGFDALFIFEPVFRFEIDFRVGASIKWKKWTLAAVSVRGTLKGPGRWEVTGHASISILWWDVGIDFEVAWGEAPAPELPSVAVGPQIAAALSAPDAWTARLPGGDQLVSLRSLEASTDVVAHPLSELVALQKVVPLGVTIDRVGRSVPSDGNRFTIDGVGIGTEDEPPALRQEHFARGEFLDLSEEEKLSTPSFERFDAGVAVSTDDYSVGGDQLAFEPQWETAYLEQDEPPVMMVVASAVLVAQAQASAVAASPLRADAKLIPEQAPVVSVAEARFVADDATRVGGGVEPDDVETLGFTAARQAAAAAPRTARVAELAEVLVR